MEGFLNCCSAMLLCYGFYCHLFSVLTFYNRLLLLDTFTLVSYVSHWLFNAISGSTCIFTVKNFGDFSELQHFANFHYFHNIPYANGLQFTKVFSVKLSTVLVYQTFCHQSFLLYACGSLLSQMPTTILLWITFMEIYIDTVSCQTV